MTERTGPKSSIVARLHAGRTRSRIVGPSQWPPSYSGGGAARRPSSRTAAPSASARAMASTIRSRAAPSMSAPMPVPSSIFAAAARRSDRAKRAAPPTTTSTLPGHAALAGAAGERVDDAAHGQRLVRVGRDDQVVLRAAEAERALAERRRAHVDGARRGVEPTKPTARTSGWSTSASTVARSPCTTEKTPGG